MKIVRTYIPALASGTMILRGIPAEFPASLAAIMWLKRAMRNNKARIRVEYAAPWQGTVREYDVVDLYREAQRRGCLRNPTGVADFDPLEDRFQCWSGATFPTEKDR